MLGDRPRCIFERRQFVFLFPVADWTNTNPRSIVIRLGPLWHNLRAITPTNTDNASVRTDVRGSESTHPPTY